MNRLSALLAVALALTAAAAPVATAGLGSGLAGPAQTDTNASSAADETPPGAQLAGVVGAQGASITGDVANRSLSVRLQAAGGPNATGGVVAEEVDALDARLANLTERKERLVRAHENGSMTTGEFHARLATVAQQIRAVEQVLNTTERAAEGLPTAVREKRGIDASAIETLRQNARNMSGQEVAEAARAIAGRNRSANAPGADRGQGVGPGGTPAGPGNSGQAGAPGNGSDPDAGPGQGSGKPSDVAPGTDAGDAENGTETAGAPGNRTAGPGDERGNAPRAIDWRPV